MCVPMNVFGLYIFILGMVNIILHFVSPDTLYGDTDMLWHRYLLLFKYYQISVARHSLFL